MIPASARLRAAIVEQRVTLPDDAELARHASDTVARHSRRGWWIDKPNPRANIDAVIALAMAVERAEHSRRPSRYSDGYEALALAAAALPATAAAACAVERAPTRPRTGAASAVL